MRKTIVLMIVLCATLVHHAIGQNHKKRASPIKLGADNHLEYTKDSLGNRIPDFSYSGYMAAEAEIPDIPLKIKVPLKQGDATESLQDAIDYVSSLKPDKNGFRGAVLLEKGVYEVFGSLKIQTSGVVLRGSGMGEEGTILLGKGKSRETLIKISGINDKMLQPSIGIDERYVPVNAMRLKLENTDNLKPGDWIMVHRPSTKEWIEELGTDHFGGGITALGWKPGQRDIYWDRKIVAVEGNDIIIDAPITTALDEIYGGGKVIPFSWQGRIQQVGVENLTLRSEFDATNLKDEDHRWMGITFENVMDAWVRRIVFEHFAGSAVAIFESAKRITVEDCKSLKPISEIGGQRRLTFFTAGQQTLFQRIYAEYGYHDFAVGYCAAGPNAFVQCDSYLPYNFSGTIDSWASGVLFDIVNVDGQALGFSNRGQDGQGAGWTAANSVLWQCTAAKINCYQPPTSENWSFGAWAQFSGNGYWESSNNHIKPRSLYYAQLQDRLQKDLSDRAQLLTIETNGTSSPTVGQALELAQLSSKPALQMTDWIDLLVKNKVLPIGKEAIKSLDQVKLKKVNEENASREKMEIQHGWLVYGKKVMTGKRHGVRWWSGSARPDGLAKSSPHITRYVPGQTGTGLTDDLDSVAEWMLAEGMVALEHNYGLWYDRRRDDHERIRRSDGDAWPPFYELPFARSGEGTAWDGLSKYDLTKYNEWYWTRLQQFADIADREGLILVHQNYFQHNILEAGAHWADSPWRTANNINDTGFPEPPPYAGDKRIFMAEQFYDVQDSKRRELHQAYIRQCLNNFVGNSSVIHLISEEYTGPLHFVEFWIDTILEWEKETGNKAFIGLSSTKDVQDAILADPVRKNCIDLIDIRYWHYREEGSEYAPQGGLSLAPRQFSRIMKKGKTSFEQVYKAVSEYRKSQPEKAVIYSADGASQYPWAVFMAGGSLAAIPDIGHEQFLVQTAQMKDFFEIAPGQWGMGSPEAGYIVYLKSGQALHLNFGPATGNLLVRRIDPKNGSILGKTEKIKANKVIEIQKSLENDEVVWISKK